VLLGVPEVTTGFGAQPVARVPEHPLGVVWVAVGRRKQRQTSVDLSGDRYARLPSEAGSDFCNRLGRF
jgi:hypothetical protein